jgi:RNA-directed DNA polymerase
MESYTDAEEDNTFMGAGSEPTLAQVAATPTLYRAWRKVRANRGASGVDAVTLRAFERDLRANLIELSRNLLNRTYEPLPARHVSIPKPNGKERELAIPTVRDRVAQRAVLDLIEPLFEPAFLDCSFAFRPGRSVEMAIQRIVVARARGYIWTVEADIHDFFPSIDHRLLMGDLARRVTSRDILKLIAQWLDAGALESSGSSATAWLGRLRSLAAEAGLAVRDAADGMVGEFVGSKLGQPSVDGASDVSGNDDADRNGWDDSRGHRPDKSIGRAAVRRLLEDGLLLAVTQRGLMSASLLGKALGLGGAALAAASVLPSIYSKLKAKGPVTTSAGAMQGSPISPLLSNIHLHQFDVSMTAQGFRLIRYCDDFVIPCRSEGDARRTLEAASTALEERRLKLSPDKSRITRPSEQVDFLGYSLTPEGRVIPPPSVPEVVARRVVELAERSLPRPRQQ